MSELKNLYKRLIEDSEDRKDDLEEWHEDYRNFYADVEKVREQIKEGRDLSSNDDGFLKKLLCKKDNGIASRGQSILSEKGFKSLIKSKNFLSILGEFIVTPTQPRFIKLEEAWVAQIKRKHPVLVNRVAAACTLDVSVAVLLKGFDQVFNWLIDEKIIPPYPTEDNQDWFSRNVFLMKNIKNVFNDEPQGENLDDFYLSQFVWELYRDMSKPSSQEKRIIKYGASETNPRFDQILHMEKQIIKYGAPGTGKTYQAGQQTSRLFNIWKSEFAPKNNLTHESQIERVQFHPSFSYEDFIEGLRPILDDKGVAQLTLQNGIFKEFCRNAGKWEIDVYGLRLNWEKLTIEELLFHKEKLPGSYWQDIFEIKDTSKLVSEAVPPFFFIIDEINRAELSRVFGELMYCLEYRGVNGKIKTQYANLNDDKTSMIKSDQGYFFIPTNIYLIGTMNVIDRSVESFDFALRRRFIWEEVIPDIKVLRDHLRLSYKGWEVLADNLEQLNGKIKEEPLLGCDYQLGHAYLMNMKYGKNLKVEEVRECVWNDRIRPLLQEYLRGTGKETELIVSFKKAFGA